MSTTPLCVWSSFACSSSARAADGRVCFDVCRCLRITSRASSSSTAARTNTSPCQTSDAVATQRPIERGLIFGLPCNDHRTAQPVSLMLRMRLSIAAALHSSIALPRFQLNPSPASATKSIRELVDGYVKMYVHIFTCKEKVGALIRKGSLRKRDTGSSCLLLLSAQPSKAIQAFDVLHMRCTHPHTDSHTHTPRHPSLLTYLLATYSYIMLVGNFEVRRTAHRPLSRPGSSATRRLLNTHDEEKFEVPFKLASRHSSPRNDRWRPREVFMEGLTR